MPIEKPIIVLPMQPWSPVRVRQAFPFLRVGHYVDGIGGRSYQSPAEDTGHPKIEAARQGVLRFLVGPKRMLGVWYTIYTNHPFRKIPLVVEELVRCQ
jgi:hypothetical protein